MPSLLPGLHADFPFLPRSNAFGAPQRSARSPAGNVAFSRRAGSGKISRPLKRRSAKQSGEKKMSTLDRRAFTREALGSVLTFSLLDSLWSCDAFAAEIKPITVAWFKELNDLGRDV